MRGGNCPPLSFVEAMDTIRLIPSKYSPGEVSVLADIADSPEDLEKIFHMDDATTDRLLAEVEQFDGIGPHELVYGIPYARVINAAFTHFNLEGNRFSVYGRNAWYAGLDASTLQAEIVYHKTIELHEMGVFEEVATYDAYLADFRCELHDLRGINGSHGQVLNPNSYVASQKLAEHLFSASSLGVIFPSVRHSGGTCLACFRPALVTNVRKGLTYEFRWVGKNKPVMIAAAGQH